MKKETFILNTDLDEKTKVLTDDEIGKVFRKILKYVKGETIPNLSDKLEMVFEFIKVDIDKNTQRYKETCEKRKQAIQTRWGKQENTNLYNCTDSIQNDYDNENHNHIHIHNHIKEIINNYHTTEIFKARELQLNFNSYLQQNGFVTKLEVKVDSNGSGDYGGFIDIVAKYQGQIIAIELDNVNPQGKSIYKLKNYQCDMRFIILRNNFRCYRIEDIEVVGLIDDTTKASKHKYGIYKNVLLKDEELQALKETYSNYQELIEYLSEYIERKGYRAKSHYLCIKKWVVDAVREENIKKARQQDRTILERFDNAKIEVSSKEEEEELEGLLKELSEGKNV